MPVGSVHQEKEARELPMDHKEMKAALKCSPIVCLKKKAYFKNKIFSINNKCFLQILHYRCQKCFNCNDKCNFSAHAIDWYVLTLSSSFFNDKIFLF
jgi:ferredoxin